MKTQTKMGAKKFQNRSRKGQVGETLTWIVATILVIVLLIFFIFGSSLLGKTKQVESFRPSLTSKQAFEGTDSFLKKSLFTYALTGSDTERLALDKYLSNLSAHGEFNIDYNQTKEQILVRYSERGK